MIDDSPWARLAAVMLFAGIICACAPFAYYLADVVRYPINHDKIKTLQSSPIQSKYIVTLTVDAHHCSASETSSWADITVRTSLSDVFRSSASKEVVYVVYTADLPSSEDPASIIRSLDATRPTPSHEMDVVLVATPDVVSVSPLYLGPTRRSVVFVPCKSHATVTRDLVKNSFDLHAALGAARSKDTDVISVPQYRVSMTLLDASPLDRRNVSITWSGATMKASLAPFLNKLGDAVVGLEIDTQIVRFVKISDKVHKSCGKDCPATETKSKKKKRNNKNKKNNKNNKNNKRRSSSSRSSDDNEEEEKKQQEPSKTQDDGTTSLSSSPDYPHFVTPKDLQRIRSLLSDGFNLESGSLSPLVAPLHLILYVPPPDETPLYVVPDKATGRALEASVPSSESESPPETDRLGFYVPRYGGVVVWNLATTSRGCSGKSDESEKSEAPQGQCQPTDKVLDIVSDLWVSQLRHLLGVTATTTKKEQKEQKEQKEEKEEQKTVVFLRSSNGISEWELDSLIRGRLSHFSRLTAKSLSALSILVQDMSHMAVPVLVGESVESSLEEHDIARRNLLAGDVASALAHVSKAFDHARLAEMVPNINM